MEKQTVQQLNQLAAKVYLYMFDVVGNHNDKAIYREKFLNGLALKDLSKIGIPSEMQQEVLTLCNTNEKTEVFTAFLFIDRTGRTLDQICFDAGLTYEEIEKLKTGEL